jgi:hypothetical protein
MKNNKVFFKASCVESHRRKIFYSEEFYCGVCIKETKEAMPFIEKIIIEYSDLSRDF